MRMYVFYHDDPDGWTSAYWVKEALEKQRFLVAYPEFDWSQIEQVDYFCVDYHSKDEILQLLLDDKRKVVVMCDFAYQPVHVMLESIANNQKIEKFVWIDHHKSNIDEYRAIAADYEENPKFDILLKEGIGACWLTMERFFPEKTHSRNVPWAVKAIAHYDVWDFFDKENQLALIFYMQSRADRFRNPNSSEWDRIMSLIGMLKEHETSPVLKKGREIYRAWLKEKVELIKTCGFKVTLAGRLGLAVCGKGLNSLPFEEFDQDKQYDFYLTFYFCNGTWTVSLYSLKEDFDCAEIARQFGGGGHPNAAGFQVDTITLHKILELK